MTWWRVRFWRPGEPWPVAEYFSDEARARQYAADLQAGGRVHAVTVERIR